MIVNGTKFNTFFLNPAIATIKLPLRRTLVLQQFCLAFSKCH